MSMLSTENVAYAAGFSVIKNKTWKAMNPGSSTEVSIRSDILKDFESDAERALREKHESALRDKLE